MSEQNQDRRIRASDAEREAVVSVLREAMSEGRLTLGEGEERIAAAYAVTYRDELPAFTTDLPAQDPPPAGPRRGQRPPWADRAAGGEGGPQDTGGPQGARGPGQRPPWRRDRRRPRPAAGLVVVLAVIAAIWAVAGNVLWPAIVLGVIALMMLKGGGGCRPRQYAGRGGSRPEGYA